MAGGDARVRASRPPITDAERLIVEGSLFLVVAKVDDVRCVLLTALPRCPPCLSILGRAGQLSLLSHS